MFLPRIYVMSPTLKRHNKYFPICGVIVNKREARHISFLCVLILGLEKCWSNRPIQTFQLKYSNRSVNIKEKNVHGCGPSNIKL